MIEAIYQYLAIPEACHLGKRVFKSLFLQKSQLGAADKKAFEQDVETIVWQYTLKGTTIPVATYRDTQREYLEIAVLQANLHRPTRSQRIAEAIHRAIPYPIFLVLKSEALTGISLASKRFNQADPTKVVAGDFHFTKLISTDHANETETAFLASLNINQLPQTNFYAMYNGWIERVIALQCARFTGDYHLSPPGTDLHLRRDRLAECGRIEENITEARRALKAETQFNRQVELNMKIKGLQKELAEKGAGL